MGCRSFREAEEGGTAIEYALILALIFLVIIGAFGLVAQRTTAMWTVVADHVAN